MSLVHRATRVMSRSASLKADARKGAILMLTVFLLIAMIAMLAFSIDYGYMLNTRTEMQRAIDSGAMAGAGVMAEGTDIADAEARKFVQLNLSGARTIANSDIQIDFGQWDTTTRTFIPGGNQVPSAIRVIGNNPGLPLFFGRALGVKTYNSRAQAVVMYLPRDIVLTLDYSGSMCFDSQFYAMAKLGKANGGVMFWHLAADATGSESLVNLAVSHL